MSVFSDFRNEYFVIEMLWGGGGGGGGSEGGVLLIRVFKTMSLCICSNLSLCHVCL